MFSHSRVPNARAFVFSAIFRVGRYAFLPTGLPAPDVSVLADGVPAVTGDKRVIALAVILAALATVP